MSELNFVVEKAPEGGYTTHAFGESIFAEADSISELYDQIRDAVLCHYGEDQAPEDFCIVELFGG